MLNWFLLCAMFVCVVFIVKNIITLKIVEREEDLVLYWSNWVKSPNGYQNSLSYTTILFHPLYWTHEQVYGDKARIKRGLKPRNETRR